MNENLDNNLPDDFKNYEDNNNDNKGEEELKEIFNKINGLAEPNTKGEDENVEEVEAEENNGENLIEEVDEEAEPEETPKKKEPTWKLKRDKFKILADNKVLMDQLSAEREQKERLQQLLEESLYSGNYHYEQSILSALEKAKTKQREALQKGDPELLLDSNIEINEALNTLREIKRSAFTNSLPPERVNTYQRTNYDPYSNTQNNNYPTTENYNISNNNDVHEQLASAWLDKHEYLQRESENYDPKLARQVLSYAKTIEEDYIRNNRQNDLFSKEYFGEIDNHIKDLRHISSKPKNLDTGAPIGGVKNSYYSPGRNKPSPNQKPELTPNEKRMAYNAGVSEDVWRHFKAEQLKEMKGRR